MVQALLSGQLDVAHFGSGPAMVARGKGMDLKVVASSTVEQISVIALPKLAAIFDEGSHATAFARFEQIYGRKPVLSTFPVGSVPEIVLHYWIEKPIRTPATQSTLSIRGRHRCNKLCLPAQSTGLQSISTFCSMPHFTKPLRQRPNKNGTGCQALTHIGLTVKATGMFSHVVAGKCFIPSCTDRACWGSCIHRPLEGIAPFCLDRRWHNAGPVSATRGILG